MNEQTDRPETVFAQGSFFKAITTSKGELLTLCVNVEKFSEFIKSNANDRGYCNFKIIPRKQPDDRGNTHMVILDTWKPGQQTQKPVTQAQTVKTQPKLVTKTVVPVKKPVARVEQEEDDTLL